MLWWTATPPPTMSQTCWLAMPPTPRCDHGVE
jgi:hypothetical protein